MEILIASSNTRTSVSLLKLNKDGYFRYACGAIVVARRWILTAAHCLEKDYAKISLGPNRCSTPDGRHEVKCYLEAREVIFGYATQQGEGAELVAEELYPYKKYRSKHEAYDIALVKLKEKIPRDKYVPICLSKGRKMDYSRKNQPYLLGWGAPHPALIKSRTLQKVSMDVLSAQECNRRNGPSKTIICTTAQNASSCWGDSGGPLSKVRNGITYLLGVLNGGEEYCPLNSMTRFSRVSKYRKWIRKHIEIKDQRRALTPATPF